MRDSSSGLETSVLSKQTSGAIPRNAARRKLAADTAGARKAAWSGSFRFALVALARPVCGVAHRAFLRLLPRAVARSAIERIDRLSGLDHAFAADEADPCTKLTSCSIGHQGAAPLCATQGDVESQQCSRVCIGRSKVLRRSVSQQDSTNLTETFCGGLV